MLYMLKSKLTKIWANMCVKPKTFSCSQILHETPRYGKCHSN